MMIDTVRVVVPVDWGIPLYGGQVISTKFDAEGQEVRDYQILKHMALEGSFSSSIQVRCVDGENLELSGSLTKWLTGHNLFGSCDLFRLLRVVLDRLASGSLAHVAGIKDWQIAETKIQRIDINEMFELGSVDEVKLFLGWVAQRASLSHRGKGALAENGCTVSWGMHRGNRSAWKVKLYAKGPESRVVRKGKPSLPVRLINSADVMSWVDRQLRMEYEINGRELDKLGARFVKDWTPETAAKLWAEKADLFFWGDDPVLIEQNLDIPRRVRNAYAAWRAGEDMRADCSRSTFFRMRGDVKRFYGCDISLPAPEQRSSNVVVLPFKRVLDLRRADVAEVQTRIERLLAA